MLNSGVFAYNVILQQEVLKSWLWSFCVEFAYSSCASIFLQVPLLPPTVQNMYLS